jgi:phosphomevalonate kinase
VLKIKKVVSAPGKVLWIGSYSVVFGGISHVIAINKRVRAECSDSEENIFETSYGTFKGKGNELIESVITQFEKLGIKLPKLHVKLYNDPEFLINGKKTGLGSSSAATVALTACIYTLLYNELDLDRIHEIAQKANYTRQKGIGSGFDIAAAVYGSIIYRRFNDINKVDAKIEKFEIGKLDMALAFIGESFNTVNSVSKFIEKSSIPLFSKIMKYIDEEDEFAIRLLKKGRIEDAIEHLRLARNMLNNLAEKIVGVKIENEITKALEKIAEKEGALFAISPGAGGESVFAIGYNLENVIEEWSKIKNVSVIRLKEDEGLRLET